MSNTNVLCNGVKQVSMDKVLLLLLQQRRVFSNKHTEEIDRRGRNVMVVEGSSIPDDVLSESGCPHSELNYHGPSIRDDI